jgi:hypothetical protein
MPAFVSSDYTHKYKLDKPLVGPGELGDRGVFRFVSMFSRSSVSYSGQMGRLSFPVTFGRVTNPKREH